MSSGSMDNLARYGIVSFSPEAYVMDGVSQYVAEQNSELPFDRPLYANPHIHYGGGYVNTGYPPRDVYVRHEERSNSWLGGLIGAALGGLATYLGIKYLGDGKANPAAAPNPAPAAKTNSKIKEAWNKVKEFFKTCKDKVVEWFKDKKGTTTASTATNGTAKNSKRFYKTKIGLGIAAGLVALYAIYKAVTGRRHNGE